MSNDHKAQDALSILRELVSVKEMREEVSRRKQRRAHSILRNPAEDLETRLNAALAQRRDRISPTDLGVGE